MKYAAAPSIIITPKSPLCAGNTNGSATASVSGGSPPYTYLWSNGGTLNKITNVPAGIYTVTVTDHSGITASKTTTVTNPPPLVVSFVIVNPNCLAQNGKVTANPTGGTGGKTYLWSNGATTKAISNLAGGTYTVTVTDSKGCTVSATAILLSPPLPSITSVAVVPLGSNWKATVSATGGTLPYKYRKCPSGFSCSGWQTSTIFTNLVAGVYTFEVKDKNSCIGSMTVNVPPILRVPANGRNSSNSTFEVSVRPQPITATFHLDIFSPSDDLKATFALFNPLGQSVFERSETLAEGENTLTFPSESLPPGIYFLTVRAGAARKTLRVVKP